jgi:hypothetical protein
VADKVGLKPAAKPCCTATASSSTVWTKGLRHPISGADFQGFSMAQPKSP